MGPGQHYAEDLDGLVQLDPADVHIFQLVWVLADRERERAPEHQTVTAAAGSGYVGGFLLARRALSLVVTRQLQVYENMVALTGVEPAVRQFS